jgi:hypothetical protein
MNSIISHSASKVFHTGTSFLVAISTLLTSIIVFFVKNVNYGNGENGKIKLEKSNFIEYYIIELPDERRYVYEIYIKTVAGLAAVPGGDGFSASCGYMGGGYDGGLLSVSRRLGQLFGLLVGCPGSPGMARCTHGEKCRWLLDL